MPVAQSTKLQPSTGPIERAAANPKASRRSVFRAFSLFLRRSHMYVALFLTPWMTMYAVSTLVFNHFERIASFYGGQFDRFEKERELAYTRTFAPGTRPYAIALEILRDLNMSGTLNVDSPGGDRMVFSRLDPLKPRRITYIPAEKKLLIERRVFRLPGFVTSLHSRVGYGSKFKAANLWAVSVDLSILGTLFWIVSGFWLWWELKATRAWGIFFTLLGMAIFAAFLLLA
jgi:hypothetical protein